MSSPNDSGEIPADHKRSREELEEENKELEDKFKRTKTAMNSIAKDYTCPISHELMIDPVTAEDGFQYEREDIETTIKVQGNALRSPKTGVKMGPKLFPAVTVRNTIQTLVESGAIDGELADQYRQNKLVADTKKKAEGGDVEAMKSLAEWYESGMNGLPEDKEKAKEWAKKSKDARRAQELKEKAEGGDAEAMYHLGKCYYFGNYGVSKDEAEAFRWYKKSSDLRHPMGMNNAGIFFILGTGGAELNETCGVSLVSMAAIMGSDSACFNMGNWYKEGINGLPRDKVEAKYWLTKATDGSCGYKHLKTSRIDNAKAWLRELEEADEEGPEN